jgi:hypothetical protein
MKLYSEYWSQALYRVIHKSLWDFRPLRYSSRDGLTEGEHVNRGRDTPKFWFYLTGVRYAHPWWRGGCQSCNQVPACHTRNIWRSIAVTASKILRHGCGKSRGIGGMYVPPMPRDLPCDRNLITGLTSAASPRVDISSTCKVGQKLRVSLPLLTCSPSALPSRLLYRRCRKSWRDMWITLYYSFNVIYTHEHTFMKGLIYTLLHNLQI